MDVKIPPTELVSLKGKVDEALGGLVLDIDAVALADPEAPTGAKALAVAFLIGAMAMGDAVVAGYAASSALGAYADAVQVGAAVLFGGTVDVRAVRRA